MLPGLLLVVLYVAYIIGYGQVYPRRVPKLTEEQLARARGPKFRKDLVRTFVLPMLLIVAVLGSSLAGLASPTEAAAIGALGAILLTILEGRFNLPTLRAVMQQTTHLTSMVFLILLGATTFTFVFRELGGDRYLVELIQASDLSVGVFLALVMLVVFVAGFFIDFIEIIFIIVPVVAPIFAALGVDLIWIGILLGLNLQTSFLTPPFGFSLFYLKSVAPPEVHIGQLYRGIVPFIVIQLLLLLVVILWPEVITMF